MNRLSRLLWIYVFLFLTLSSVQEISGQRFRSRQESSGVDCSEDSLKVCTQQLLKFSSEDMEVPRTEKEVIDSCNLIRNGTRCIRRYMGSCAPTIIKQMGKMAMGGVSRTINKRCSPEGIQTFLEHRECIVNVRKPARLCYQSLVRDMYRIKGAKIAQVHPAVCCFISKMHECNTEAVLNNCKEESQEYYGQETAKLMDEMMDLICPENLRWGLVDCDKLENNLPQASDDLSDEDLSILPLVMDLMKRLAEDDN